MVASALSFIPQEYHADILAGTSTVDVASYLNAGLESERILQLPDFGLMSVASTVHVPSGGGILGANFGCTIKALPNFGNNPVVCNANRAPRTAGERDRDIVLLGIRVDGNKANNTVATEFGHCISLKAVNGARLDVQSVDPQGDGLSLQQAGIPGTPNWFQDVGCSNIVGRVRTSGCRRQGVAIICAEQVDLDVHDSGTQLMSVDIEPDDPNNFIRNIFIRLLSNGTGNGSDVSGGVTIGGDGLGCVLTNVTIDFEIYDSGGQGVIWRDCKGLILRGTITNAAKNGLLGIDSGFGASQVTFEGVRVFSPGYQGLSSRETPGSVYDGQIIIEDAGGIGAHLEGLQGGVLGLTIRRSGQAGLYLRNTSNMVFPSAIVESSASHNVLISGNSTGNRFPFLKSVSSNFGSGFLEEPGGNDNKASFARVTGNGNGNVSLSGANSAVTLEP